MEFKSVSTKINREQFTLLQDYCEKKGITPSTLIRDSILKELKIVFPHNVAGKNKILYNKERDNFSWFVELDDGQNVEILKNVSMSYLEQLQKVINEALETRQNTIKKTRKDSVAVPSSILKRMKK
jgi:hypothetical protein